MGVDLVPGVMVLSILAEELATTLSALAKHVSSRLAGQQVGEEQLRQVIQELADRELVRLKDIGGGETVVSITAEGAKEAERTTKRGMAAFF